MDAAALFSLDEICDRFEDAYLQGASPQVEDFVARAREAERLETLREILRVDLHYRRLGGNVPTIEEYQVRFPQLENAWLEQLLTPPVSTSSKIHRGHDRKTDLQPPGLPKIPGYELLEEIGRGGMGVVFRARQLGLNRLVAIKMMLTGDLAGTELLERFRAEARAVGRLQHPNLVQIYEVGDVDGQPFLSFEYIRGGSLAQRLAGQSQPPRPAALLLWTLANAVQFAHSRGVIHRDLKPANILLDADFEVKPQIGGVKTRNHPLTPTTGDPGREHRTPQGARQIGIKAHGDGLSPIGADIQNSALDRRREKTPPITSSEPRSDHAKRNSDADRKLIVETYGIPKISDFGLAKQLEEGTSQTRTGAILGTPSYMSPEQAAGQSQAIGPATDIYSLGSILYEMLTGRPPFRAPTVIETLDQVRSREPLSLRSIEPTVPRDLETICLKCLQKEPTRRYLSAEELSDDLDRYLRDVPVLARPVSSTERTFRWCRRHPLAATLVLLLVLVTTTGFAGILYQWRQSEILRELAVDNADAARRQKEMAETQRALSQENFQKAELNWQRAEAAREHGERVIYLQNITAAHQALQAHDAILANELLEKCRPDLREWEWHFLQRQCKRGVRVFRGHTDFTTAAAFSPDGTRLAAVSGMWGSVKPGGLCIWDVATGNVLETRNELSGPLFGVTYHPLKPILVTGGVAWGARNPTKLWDHQDGHQIAAIGEAGNTFALTISPDGRLLALAGADGRMRLCDASTGQILQTFTAQAGNLFGIAFSPDSRLVASGSRDGSIQIYDTSTNAILHRFEDLGDVRSVAFSPDGELLAAITYLGLVMLWDTNDWSEFAVHHARAYTGGNLRFSPDGQSLAVGAGDKLQLWDPATGEVRKDLPGHWRNTFVGEFSPDGRALASCGNDRLIRVLDLTTEPDGQPTRLELANFADIDISTDGRFIAAAATRDPVYVDRDGSFLLIWSLDGNREVRRIRGHTDILTSVMFAPDGTHVATGSHDRTIRIWDVETGQALQTLAAHDAAVLGIAYGPDGSTLASASADRTIKIWNLRTSEVERTLVGHTAAVTRVIFTSDGENVISASEDGEIRFWPLHAKDQPFTLSGHSSAVKVLALSHDEKRLASAGLDQQVLVWDLAAVRKDHSSARPLLILQDQFESVHGLDFSPDDRRLVSASENRGPTLWDLATGQAAFPLLPNPGGPARVRFTPDGHRIVMVSRLDMSIWDDRLADEQSSDERIRLAMDWHRREAQLADQRGSSFAVMHHLRQIPDSQFDNDLRQIRAVANARRRNWSAAAADLESVVSDVAKDLRPNEIDILQRDGKTNVAQRQLTLRLYNLAAIKLLSGDEVEYRRWTRQLTEGITTPSDAFVINGIAWTWCLGAHEAADILPIVQMVQAELSKATQSSQRNELMNTMGALLYRAGRFDEAISKLNASIAANGNGGVVEDWLFLSMAHRRLGRDDDAAQWLQKSRGAIENLGRHSRPSQHRRATTNWDTTPIQEHLFREAESLPKPK